MLNKLNPGGTKRQTPLPDRYNLSISAFMYHKVLFTGTLKRAFLGILSSFLKENLTFSVNKLYNPL